MFAKHQELMSGLRGKGMPPPAAGKKPDMKAMMPKVGGEEGDGGGGGAMELHPHGDGTFHTMVEGQKEEHPDHLSAIAHLAHHAEPEGKHMHIHHDGFSMKSHGTDESGQHDGTHDHENLDELKGSMDKFLGEEGHEGEGGEGHEGGEGGDSELSGY